MTETLIYNGVHIAIEKDSDEKIISCKCKIRSNEFNYKSLAYIKKRIVAELDRIKDHIKDEDFTRVSPCFHGKTRWHISNEIGFCTYTIEKMGGLVYKGTELESGYIVSAENLDKVRDALNGEI